MFRSATLQTRTPAKLVLAMALGIAALTMMASAQAQDRVAQQIKLRQSAYTVLGAQVGPMGAMVSGRAPFDAAAFQTAATRAAFMATVVPDVFPAGSVGANSKAKPEIWQNKADFDKLMADLGSRTAALAEAAKSGNLDTIRPAFAAAAAACKACHDKYRLE